MSPLDAAAGVRAGYEHVAKVVQPGSAISVSGGLLKWYEIATASSPVAGEISALARDALLRAVPELAGELGFVILHRCGESFYFLLVSTWRNENELWETVWAKPGDDADGFSQWPLDGGHRPTFCVWELRAVSHEQGAWSRYLRSARDAVARREYLKDTYTGLA